MNLVVKTFLVHLILGRLHEGMRELERILDKPEVILSAPMLLTYAHKQCETVGKTPLAGTKAPPLSHPCFDSTYRPAGGAEP
jgi:hypothetical protein